MELMETAFNYLLSIADPSARAAYNPDQQGVYELPLAARLEKHLIFAERITSAYFGINKHNSFVDSLIVCLDDNEINLIEFKESIKKLR